VTWEQTDHDVEEALRSWERPPDEPGGYGTDDVAVILRLVASAMREENPDMLDRMADLLDPDDFSKKVH